VQSRYLNDQPWKARAAAFELSLAGFLRRGVADVEVGGVSMTQATRSAAADRSAKTLTFSMRTMGTMVAEVSRACRTGAQGR
jgi:hypothetical protein